MTSRTQCWPNFTSTSPRRRCTTAITRYSDTLTSRLHRICPSHSSTWRDTCGTRFSKIYLTESAKCILVNMCSVGRFAMLCPLHTFSCDCKRFKVAHRKCEPKIAVSNLVKTHSQVNYSHGSGHFGYCNWWRHCCESLLVAAHPNGYVRGK